MSSKLDIINAAFILLGHRTVNSLGDNSGEDIKKASSLYDLYYNSFLTYYSWRFAIKQLLLSKINNPDPVLGYDYAYQLPPDYLAVYKLEPMSRFEIYETYLYTNLSSDVKLYYTHKVSESVLPAYYIEFLIEKFAEIFAMPITQQLELVEIWGKSADEKLNRAIALDSQSQTSLTIMDNPLGRAKYSSNLGL